MKFKNIQTLEHLIMEYGLQPGKPTPVGQQQTGSVAKATSASPTTKAQSASPTTQKTPLVKEPEVPATITKSVKDIPVDTELKDKSGKLVGTVVTPIGDKANNPDAVVIKNKLNKYDVVEPDEKFDIDQDPEMESLINELEQLSLGEQLTKLSTVDSDVIHEAWSKKYKDSINCSSPKGFSQKAHCAGKKKKSNESNNYHANRTGFSRGARDDERHDLDTTTQQWALKINGKVWTKGIFASKEKALKARQTMLAKNPNQDIGLVTRNIESIDENLRKWFNDKWVRFGPDGKIKGDCARGDDSEGKPKCLPQSKAHSLGKKGRASAARRKRREDPNPERKGAAKNVATKKESVVEYTDIPFNVCPSCGGGIVHESQLNEKQDACYHKVKRRYKVWPSAYASGALVQCRKKGAKNWGNSKKESVEEDYGRYYCSTDKKWKTRQGPKQKRKVNESVLRDSVPDNSKIRILNNLLSKPFLATDVKGQMNAFFAIPDPNMINDFRRARAENGDGVCLRPILRNYVKKMHPMLIKQINLNESVKLKEYDDLAAEQAKIAEIIKTLDISDERDAKLVDQIWRILNSDHIQSVIGNVVAKPIADETAMNKEAATKVLTKVIYQVESDYKTIKMFLDDLEESGTAINVEELKKPGVNSFANLFKSQMAFDVFKALMPYGAGKQKKGPGEFALAMLSNRIKLSEGGGDIVVDNELVELKASSSETSSGGGRLGMNPLSQPQVLAILSKFQNDVPSIMQHMQSNASLGLGNAVQLMNNDLPVGDQRRYNIAYAVYSAFMSDKAAKFIATSFKNNSNASVVLKDFAIANYEDYKEKSGFAALLGLVLNAKKTVYITSAQEFADFFAGPHAGAPGVSFIPTKAGPTEMFLQLNLKKSGKI